MYHRMVCLGCLQIGSHGRSLASPRHLSRIGGQDEGGDGVGRSRLTGRVIVSS